MSETVGATKRPGRWERAIDTGFLWFLPGAAATSLALGSALLILQLAGAGAASPVAPFLLGWGAFAALVAFYWDRTTTRPSLEVEKVPLDTATNVATAPGEADSIPAARPRNSSASRGSEWRVLAVPTSPGDETWLSWLPREIRRLGAEAGVPPRGAAYSPGPPGSLIALPTRKETSGGRSPPVPGEFDRNVPSPSTGSLRGPRAESPGSLGTSREHVEGSSTPNPRRHGFSEDELDRMFPPDSGGRTLFLSQVPDKVGLPQGPRNVPSRLPPPDGPPPETETPLAGGTPSPYPNSDIVSSPPGFHDVPIDLPALVGRQTPPLADLAEETPVAVDPTESLLLAEASNPIPPHLRSGAAPPLFAARATRPSSLSRAPAKSVCASCSKVVLNLRMSGPCPKCLRPICNECLREAFLQYGQGWCVDCSAASPVGASVGAN